MVFKSNNITTQKEVLKRKLGGELFEPITLVFGTDVDVIKAGSPISAAGTVVNADSGGADPVGILLNDVYKENPNGTILKAFGCINLANANANAGITIATGVKTKLPLIVFE